LAVSNRRGDCKANFSVERYGPNAADLTESLFPGKNKGGEKEERNEEKSRPGEGRDHEEREGKEALSACGQ
jgi:hypothetical protein